MITEWELYWITRCTDIKIVLVVLSIVFFFATLATVCLSRDSFISETARKEAQRWAKLAVCVLILSAVATVLVPTTKEMVLIQVLPKVVNSEYVQKQLPEDLKEIRTSCLKLLKEVCNDGN